MVEPIWRGAVEIRWKGNSLMLRRLCIGVTIERLDAPGWLSLLSYDEGAYDGIGDFPTEAEARSAIVTAAVRALGGEE